MAVSSLTKLKRLSEALGSVGQQGGTAGGSQVNHTQFNKNVVLRLYTNGVIDKNISKDQEFVFPINPEEFNLSRNERVQVVQTLGEPFVDEYGKGMPTLTIRGTTGWRTRPSVENVDGHEAFVRLHRNFIDRYFDLRLQKIEAKLNPDDIILVVTNNVDDLSYKVIPQNFRLLRNRNKPLLYQYEITFAVLQDLNAPAADEGALNLPFKPKSKNWLTTLIDRTTPLTNKLRHFATPVCNTVAGFMEQSVSVLENAQSGVGDIANFLHGVSSGIKLALDATRNTQAFINNLPIEAILELNELTSVVGEFNCYLKNGLTESWLPDFSGVCGVTDCASTHGIKSGEIADKVDNAVEWVVEMREAATRSGSTAAIGIRHSDTRLPNMFGEPNTAIVMESTLDNKLAVLTQVQKDPTSAVTLNGVYESIENVFEDLDIDAARLPANSTTENLKKISQYKMVEVKEGDTLYEIAYREFGDAGRWTEIAAANDIVIESATELFAPLTSFTIGMNLYRGRQAVDIGMTVPSNYAEPGCILSLKDSQGAWQRLQVKAVNGSKIEFFETFARNYVAPINIVRMKNLVDLGVYDGETTLTAPFVSGQKTMHLNDVKDIYPGYVLYATGAGESRSFTVEKVNYLEKTVTTKEASIGFAAGAKVRIYNTETSQAHIIPGMELKIPVTSGDQSSLVQTASEVYGRDIATNSAGVLLVENGDLALISGLANLKQAIEHRVLSDYESLIVHPRYGCGLLAILGTKNTPAVRSLAKAALVDALNREPRLDRITKLRGFAVGDAIKFTLEVEGTDSNTVSDLNFVIGGIN